MRQNTLFRNVFLLLLTVVFLGGSLLPALAGAKGGIRNSSFVILRAEPRLESEAVAVLPFMEELTVDEDHGDWVRVSCSKGSGYMRRLYLRYGDEGVGSVPPATSTATAPPSTSVTGEATKLAQVELGSMRAIQHSEPVYMRAAMALASDSPTLIPPGASVKIIEVHPGWCKVEYDGKVGFIRCRYLGIEDTADAIGMPPLVSTPTTPATPPPMLPPPPETTTVTPPPMLPPPTATIDPSSGRIQDPGIQGKAYEGPGSIKVAEGVKDDSWRASFDRTNAMSDHEFTDAGSMSQPQIQSFLESKGSVLSKPVNGMLPSQAILDAANRNGINPKVLLARLQTEQGLISKKTATQKQLDWALGVGAYDSGNWNQNYKGFDKQVDGAARTMRKWYDDGKVKGGSMTMKIDGKTITTRNATTYSLYKYTPHFAGTQLNWKVYTGYFK